MIVIHDSSLSKVLQAGSVSMVTESICIYTPHQFQVRHKMWKIRYEDILKFCNSSTLFNTFLLPSLNVWYVCEKTACEKTFTVTAFLFPRDWSIL